MESIRFTGLASGMNTQEIVDSMMRAERMPLDRVKQQKQVLEWQRDDFRDMNKLLKEFHDFIFDGIYRQSKMLTRAVTSSNSDFVSATAGADAGNVSYDIKNVQLATAARVQSTNVISNDKGKIDPTKSLWSQRDKLTGLDFKQSEELVNKFTVPKGGTTEFQLTLGAISDLPSTITVDGKDYTVRVGNAKPEDLQANEVFINDETGRVSFGEKLEEEKTFDISFKQNYLEFNIETYNEDGSVNKRESNFKYSATTSLNSVFNEINKSNVGVNMFYDSGSDRVVAQRKETGELVKDNKSINFTGDSASFFTDVLQLSAQSHGTDAKFTINGLETTRKSNTFTMNDVTFILKKNSVGDESSSINVKTDTEAIYKTIKEFVDKYNEVIGKINGKLTEERYRAFSPLTDEQKAAMNEKDIDKWEEKAKSGLLRRDSLLSSGLSKMRTDLYAEVTANERTLTDNKYNQLTEIGIKTTKDYLERGKLEIDETKLKAAIEDNPDAVYQLFMAEGSDKHSEKGLARRLRDSISDTMKKIEEKAGNTFKTEHNYSMGKDILRMNSSIAAWEERLKQKEARYWNQFNSMEKAMQQLNNQSSQLLAQLGLGNQK
ncbi:flagellar hook-associated protein 2 [Bacillus sp. Bva_UNVM-123]|uniref:flagellar hook-associated protein 2 n=1 Tax=Bacillus sp. Bva_UNVM-123 TaxID=2829798 RepID=UPI00391F589B